MKHKAKTTIAFVLSIIATICIPAYGLIPLVLMIIYKEKEKNGTAGEQQTESLLRWSYIILAILYSMFIITFIYLFNRIR